MKHWQPDVDLDHLLVALGEEIIDTSDEDVRAFCGQAGSPLSGIARDMRTRIAKINDGGAESTPAPADIAIRRELPLRSH